MVGRDAAIRTFIALHISEEARRALAEVIESLGTTAPRGVRWVNPQSIHLTLKFLGEIEPGRTDQILGSLRQAGEGSLPFSLGLSGLGVFPNNHRPRVLWAGIAGDLDSLTRLQERVEEAMLERGFARESRPFNAHLTIGRVRDGISAVERRLVGDAVAAASLMPTEPWPVESVHLVQSTLNPQGAVYTSLGSAAL